MCKNINSKELCVEEILSFTQIISRGQTEIGCWGVTIMHDWDKCGPLHCIPHVYRISVKNKSSLHSNAGIIAAYVNCTGLAYTNIVFLIQITRNVVRITLHLFSGKTNLG